MIYGITITLLTRDQVGTDEFNRPVYSESEAEVDDVLVGYPTPEERLETFNLTGRRVHYTLGIPKGDTHAWEGNSVILPEPFSGKYSVIGIPVAAIEKNVPLRWNKKVQIERYG